MSARLYEVTDEQAAAVAAVPGRELIRSIVFHGSYLINYAKPIVKDSYEIKSLSEDVRSAAKLGGLGAVLHFGKALKLPIEEAEKYFVDNIHEALRVTDGVNAAVIIENMAGQGSEMCRKMEDFGRVFRMFNGNTRVKMCVDTAHLMGGGYDLSQPEVAITTLKLIDSEVGWNNVACVHFNDSKKPADSHLDRHEDIGKGTIGIDGLKTFALGVYEKNPNIALILETPETSLSYKEQIDIMKGWF